MTLFDEFKIGDLTLKNRLAMAPMGTLHGADGGINAQQRAYLVERAKGGFGLIYPSAHTVSDKYERPCSSGNFLCKPEHEPRLARAAEEIHKYGAKFAVQLSPGYGRVNKGFPKTMCTHVSASDNTVFSYPDYKCRALEVDEIHELVEAAGRAAAMAKNAGVDILEVHAYGGYMLDQFLSRRWNRREDEYGGSLDNRMRFLTEFYGAMRQAVGPDYPISIKFTPEHCTPEGRTFEDEGLEIVRRLSTMGFAYLHLDNGCYEVWNKAIPSAYEEPGCQVHVAERLRREGITLPFVIQGKLNYPALAQSVISSGTADIIALGHQSLADPYWPTKVREYRLDDIDHCMCCNECINSYNSMDKEPHGFSCAINPATGFELSYKPKKADPIRKVLVVGAGPGGMYTAATAASLGHDVTLWEKNSEMGGLLRAAGAPDFKIDMHHYMENLISKVKKSGAEICLNKTATAEAIDEFEPDVVILACGAEQSMPPIPGINGENVVTAYNLLANSAPVGKRVVVIGGGHVGVEAALHLERLGKKVSLVEMASKLLTASSMADNAHKGLLEMVENSSIDKFVGARVMEIGKKTVTIAQSNNQHVIHCDSVVLAAGFHSDHVLEEQIQNRIYKVFSIGDYVAPGKVYQAVHGGSDVIQLLNKLEFVTVQ